MTYGWAILVVLVVIGALSYFGVLSPSTLLPEKCTFPVSVSCTDYQVTTSNIVFVLQNGAGRDMRINRISASSEALGGTGAVNLGCACDTPAAGYPVTLRNGASATFTLNTPGPGAGCAAYCTFRDTGRDKNRYNVTTVYEWLDSTGIDHELPGELLARRT
ncbi:hypothetical protein HYY73_01615 [Candidatus Woesearchaeota archaeon]|nr:hypothetical protein [Candidatus Woesearchaeota archaeon]